MSDPAAAPCELYLVTPPALDPEAFRDTLAAALDAGEVAAVQLRLKDADEGEVRRAIDVLRPVAQSRGVAFLLNDRPDLAAACGCDGAHVGQGDMPARDARRLLGPRLTLGVSCNASRDLAMAAGEDGADYVAFGAFFLLWVLGLVGGGDVKLFAAVGGWLGWLHVVIAWALSALIPNKKA